MVTFNVPEKDFKSINNILSKSNNYQSRSEMMRIICRNFLFKELNQLLDKSKKILHGSNSIINVKELIQTPYELKDNKGNIVKDENGNTVKEIKTFKIIREA